MERKPYTDAVMRTEPMVKFCPCCSEPATTAMHQVRTIDGRDEWMCGRHKRLADLVGLAANGKGSEDNTDLADYMRDILKRADEKMENTDTPITERVEALRVDYTHPATKLDPRERVEQACLIMGYNAALLDVKKMIQDDEINGVHWDVYVAEE